MASPYLGQMTDPLPELERVSTSRGSRGSRTRLRIAVGLTAVAAVIGLAVVAGGGPLGTTPAPATSSSAASRSPFADLPSGSSGLETSGPSGGLEPPASGGVSAGRVDLVAAVDDRGALTTVDAHGGFRDTYAVPGVIFGFPAWSPDGSQIAVVGVGAADAAIYVFNVDRRPGAPGLSQPPTIVYRSVDHQPFYLYWTPDGRHISFLTDEDIGLALRVSPVDGIATFDGDGPSAILRRGAPLYFDWLDPNQALVHVGSGREAFVGAVGLDGGVVGGSTLVATGTFRPAVLSHDGRYVAYATSGADSIDAIVVAARDRSTSRQILAYGPSAMLFDPVGDTLATIAATKVVKGAPSVPLGPLRLVDPASGSVRTLLDDAVVAFFWSPDGQTIAAIQTTLPDVGPVAGTSGSTYPGAASRAVLTSAGPPQDQSDRTAASVGVDAGLVFIDVATGTVRSRQTVRLADHFVGQLLPYFDQYALSHQLWSPDSTSLLLPLATKTGQDQIVVVPADGSAPRPIADGAKGFWSP